MKTCAPNKDREQRVVVFLLSTTVKLFERETLTQDDSFFAQAESTPKLVEGKNQKVYWRSCIILVFNSNDTATHVEQHNTCDEEGTVAVGTSLWFGGDNGKVVES